MKAENITFPLILALVILAVPASAVTHAVADEFVSSGTWLAPPDVNSVALDVCGGGAGGTGGGYHYDSTTSGYQGSAGTGGSNGTCIHIDNLSVTPGQSYPITIGPGGLGSSYWLKNVRYDQTTYVYNGSWGTASTAFGYYANGGHGDINNITISYNNSTHEFTLVTNGLYTGYNGYGTSVIAESGSQESGSCVNAGAAGYSGGNGYGAGGGGGAKGDLGASNTCNGGQGGNGAQGYAKITYLSETGTTTVWYSQQLVEIKVVDAYQNPISLVSVSARYISSSLPSQNASFLTAAFGISSQVAKDMVDSNIAMNGTTDSQGALSMMLFPAIRYGFWIENATLGVNNYVEISPKEEKYTVVCPRTGQVAGESHINQSLTTKLPFYKLNTSYYNLSMIFFDPEGKADNVIFTVYDHTGGDTIVYQKDWGDPNTNIIIDNYTVYLPLGQEYIWQYNATYL